MSQKKTLYTLCVDNFEPAITAITFPLLKAYADKIGAEFYIISQRKHPDMPPVYEKFQIWDIEKERRSDWIVFMDADALFHPDFWDPTAVVGKDMTIGYASDFVPIRWEPDKYFLRDRRWIGKGNWISFVSDWCLDYWHPLDDITFEEAVKCIHPTHEELSTVIKPSHLIDDWLVSRNIARYGLKHVLIPELCETFKAPMFMQSRVLLPGQTQPGLVPMWFHEYRMPAEQKVPRMQQKLREWGIDDPSAAITAKPKENVIATSGFERAMRHLEVKK